MDRREGFHGFFFPIGTAYGPTGKVTPSGVNYQGVNFEIFGKNGRLKFENFRKTREKHFEEIAFTWECNLLQSPIFELVVWTW